jgi:sulfite exporter TauE/SafE
MITEAITGGLILGAFSSLHCIGMCGPLALALPVQHLPVWQQRFAALLYNAGRIVTYTLLGLLFGLAGRGLYMAGFQQWLSIISGGVILVFIINYYFLKKAWQPKWTLNLHATVQQLMIKTLRTDRKEAYLLLGMVNGLLPCGMVYVALAAALNFSQVQQSVLFMSGFGAGTLPLMLLLSIAGSSFSFSIRGRIKKVVPYLMTVMAFLLILRGLNLGIPFVSPLMASEPATALPCH